jgi:hypothetical protein
VTSVVVGDDFVSRVPVQALDKERRGPFATSLRWVVRQCTAAAESKARGTAAAASSSSRSPHVFLDDTAIVLDLCDKCTARDGAANVCGSCVACVARAAVRARGSAHERAAEISTSCASHVLDVAATCRDLATRQRALLLDVLSADYGFTEAWWARVQRRRANRCFGFVAAVDDVAEVVVGAATSDDEVNDAIAELIFADFIDAVEDVEFESDAPDVAVESKAPVAQPSRLPTLRRTAFSPTELVDLQAAATAAPVTKTKIAKSAKPTLSAKKPAAVPAAAAASSSSSSTATKTKKRKAAASAATLPLATQNATHSIPARRSTSASPTATNVRRLQQGAPNRKALVAAIVAFDWNSVTSLLSARRRGAARSPRRSGASL